MEKYDVKFKKRFGQNFLKDNRIVKRMVDISGVNNQSLVIEVGPGGGILTKELSSFAKYVLCYEIDTDLTDELSTRLEECDNVDILFQDFLTSDIENDIAHYSFDSLYFISNVPYYITTPILMKLIQSDLPFEKVMMMVQEEVGNRFTSKPGSREYGSITVLLNYYFDIKKEFFVSRREFVPEPNVDSVVVSFTRKNDKYELKNYHFFEQLVRDSFQYKRKTIKNNLKGYDLKIVEKVLQKYQFDLNARAEMLAVEIFVDLANSLYK